MKYSRVGIIGGGRSGTAAARLLSRLGAKVFLSDRGSVEGPVPAGVVLETGKHSRRLLQNQLLIRSPGVPSALPVLRQAKKLGIPIWSELELGYRYCLGRSMLGITGTNGKTTTTTLVGAMLKASGRPTVVAGNIGTPLSTIALQGLTRKRCDSSHWLVLEVSSYQLENIDTFHPAISAILNITPDHLEHHGTMASYAAAKARIFENQTTQDVCVLNADDAWCRMLSRRCRARVIFFSRSRSLNTGIFLQGNEVVFRWGKIRWRWPLEMKLVGPHNLENALAAIAMAGAAGVSSRVVRSVLREFKGVEHRLELVRTRRGVQYINDSKATNVDSTRMALASFDDPLILILGGEGKGAPYEPLRSLIQKGVRQMLLIGEDAPVIARSLKGSAPFERVGTLARAVRRAAQLARPGEIVLLSPACASFDQYENYEERGRHFKALVRALR